MTAMMINSTAKKSIRQPRTMRSRRIRKNGKPRAERMALIPRHINNITTRTRMTNAA